MKFLVAYDGSPQANEALKLAKQNALALNAKVFVVTSLFGDKETTSRDIEQAEDGLDYAKKLLSESGVDVETHLLVHGRTPGEDLVEFAKENEIDQIFVGVRKVSQVGKMLFGSTARHLILNAPCPVVSVK
jgi:nucleotide-binding universal stress UspA family protein|uniref:Universal stress protein n=1 Tax=Desulfomonile tiedjei TaxID=2358 RepID=A0A7C4EW27_9BACT